MGNKLEWKIAVITGGGGSSGIGLATAKRFVSERAYISKTDKQKKKLDTAVSEIDKNIEVSRMMYQTLQILIIYTELRKTTRSY